MSLNPSANPGTNFDLDNWKLQLPVDSSGGFSGRYAEVRNLDSYTSSYFHTGSDGAMVLSAPVEGVTTGGSSYARTELRELIGGANAEWKLDQGGYLAVAMQVDGVPEKTDGTDAKIVIGQIHGGDHQLVRLYYEHGTVYWVNGRNEVQAKDIVHQLTDASGRTPDIDLDETFSYSFDVKGHDLKVALVADGKTYSSSITIGGGWDDNSFYFKAGLYLGTNESTSNGDGQVSIYDIDVTHDGSTPGLDIPGPTTSRPSTVISDNGAVATLNGTAGNDIFSVSQKGTVVQGGDGFDTVRASSSWTMSADVERLELTGSGDIDGTGSTADDMILGNDGVNRLKGCAGADQLLGGGGNDSLGGSSGNDSLDGGDGADVLSGSSGDDSLTGGAGADWIMGGGDRDILTGGLGDDVFVFTSVSNSRAGSADAIRDFASGEDMIDLRLIDANTKLSGNQAFDWGGSGAGHLVFANGVLSADLNGDGSADFKIDLGSARIDEGDLFL
jgi:Ca2+-binding RTX toxin-like protein